MAKTISSQAKSRASVNLSSDLLSTQPQNHQDIAISNWQIVHVTTGLVNP
ncbi:hypothetical protein H6G04_33025 [Calothrix membranacea FACHB-236]|nr:hypothetical protein [Calothrix membranacea FACHB-236]